MAKNLYETLTGAPKPRKRWTPLRIVRCFLLVYLLYFAVGALLPFTLHPGVCRGASTPPLFGVRTPRTGRLWSWTIRMPWACAFK